MKIGINKSAKRVLSIALAFALLVGTLFTANVGVTITADAATDPTVEKTVLYWDGSTSKKPTTGTGTEADPYIIKNPGELHFIAINSTITKSEYNTTGKHYRVADNMVFVLQPQSVIDDLDAFKAKSADEVKEFFQNADGKVNWLTRRDPQVFNGFFDGNGVEIYGLYSDGCAVGSFTAGSNSSALFPNIDGGGDGTGTSTTASTDDKGITIKNLAVYNSYVIGIRFAGVLVGTAQYNQGGAYVNGKVNVDGVVLANNYVDGVQSYTAGSGAAVTVTAKYADQMGVLSGAGVNDPMHLTNSLIYGNKGYCTYDDGTVTELCLIATNWKRANYGTINNCLVLGTEIRNQFTANLDVGSAGIYNDHPASTHATIVKVTAGESLYGTTGASKLGAFLWAGKDTDLTDGKTYWFVRENDYPTPIQPADNFWKTAEISFIWGGAAASGYADGTGTKEDPFIIQTPEQLYRALSAVTYTTATTGDLAVETAESVAGGYQSGRILKEGSDSVYVPVYTPYYYKVSGDVDAFYLNDIYDNETLAGAKAMAATDTKIEWKPGKSFVGYLDGNGVTIYGMYSSTGQGLVYKLDGSSTVENFNFDSCYSTSTGSSAMVTTLLGTYTNDSTLINISNISVRNSYIGTTRNITLNPITDSEYYSHTNGAAGIVSSNNICEKLTISNCLYDGYSCERSIGSGSDVTSDMLGGIVSGANNTNNMTLVSCVSLGAPVVNEVNVDGKEVLYNRYDASNQQVLFYNSYSDMPLELDYEKLADIERVDQKAVYTIQEMPKLLWRNWSLVNVDDDRTIPMPKVNTATKVFDSYVGIIGKEYDNLYGIGPYTPGSNPFVYTLKGSGTEEDPFLIETDAQLARAIATGGMNLYDRLYYKLCNDIDLSGGIWLNIHAKDSNGITYSYTPFGGQLDGNGHVITGLNAGDDSFAGLIPVLAKDGVVKNIHMRDSYVVSSTVAGVIAGEQQEGSTITNCSVENSTVIMSGEGLHIVGSANGDLNNLYFINADGKYYYVDENGTSYGDYTGVQDTLENFIANKVKVEGNNIWYMGGKEGSVPRLVNLNSHFNDLDIVGDGKADSYDAADLTALRNKLLKKQAYKYINGDVSRNGSINIADLAVLQRTIVDDYGSKISDSFFGNVQAGNVKIYYGENDNYDAARKLEVYLEQLTGADIVKYVSTSKGTVTGADSDASKVYLHQNDEIGTPDGKLDIIVGTLDNVDAYSTNTVATGANTYAVTYDEENKVVWIQGQNFTAVEQAVINFTKESKVDGDVVYTCGSTVLDAEKQPVTVTLDTDFDGSITDNGGYKNVTYYYAWGDEFEEDTLDTHNWVHFNQHSEGQTGEKSAYLNQEIAPVKDLGKLITVTDGRLSIKRGYRGTSNTANGYIALDITDGEFNGYNVGGASPIESTDQYFSAGKITTSQGMLFKQGYIEIKGQLPADGHAFPAWWLMGRPAQTQSNSGYDNSLYGKVYKLNPLWNGKADGFTSNDLTTFKYQIPSVFYEIDMIEVMQDGSKYGYLKEKSSNWNGDYYLDRATTNDNNKAVAWYMINSTIHKYYNNGYDSKNGEINIIDWDNKTIDYTISKDDFSTTSAGSYIHKTSVAEYDFGTPTKVSSTNGSTYYAGDMTYNASAAATARNALQKERRYGFSWNTSASGFEATLYVYDVDGAILKTVPVAYGKSGDSVFKDKQNTAEGSEYTSVYSDAEVFNQYMYILLDNKFYSANASGYSTGHRDDVVQFTDLLGTVGLTSLEIDYVRVYQEKGCRDIVTPETENFNNDNHFGYF